MLGYSREGGGECVIKEEEGREQKRREEKHGDG